MVAQAIAGSGDKVTSFTNAFLTNNSEPIVLTVEGLDVSYSVPKALLLEASPWFEAALSKNFAEGITGTIHFSSRSKRPETNKQLLQLFVHWIFQRRLPQFEEIYHFDEDGVADQGMHDEHSFACGNVMPASLFCLWLFAEERLMPKLQNEAMKLIMAVGDSLCIPFRASDEYIGIAFDRSEPFSPLQKWTVKACIDHVNYEPEEMDMLGQIPGFFYLYRRELSRLNQKKHTLVRGLMVWETDREEIGTV